MLFQPSHPGKMIRQNFLEPLSLTMTDLASAMGVSVSSISRVVNEKSEMTADMALRLSHVLGIDPKTWMHMQALHSLHMAEKNFLPDSLIKLNSPSEPEELSEQDFYANVESLPMSVENSCQ
ncbi:HigA family addiction module antitoxin [Vreelandella venusta]|uniref:HigA family addiction module antitoxin n=1 Tax=Vreelandella venusta TaxID=44935 RepID=UPI004043D76B